jgi:hypothetical protein
VCELKRKGVDKGLLGGEQENKAETQPHRIEKRQTERREEKQDINKR